MILYVRRLLWKLEDNAAGIVKACVLVALMAVFWSLFFYLPVAGAFK